MNPLSGTATERLLRGLSFLSLVLAVLVPLLAPANLPFSTMFFTAVAAVIFGFVCYVGARLVASEVRTAAANENFREHFTLSLGGANGRSRG